MIDEKKGQVLTLSLGEKRSVCHLLFRGTRRPWKAPKTWARNSWELGNDARFFPPRRKQSWRAPYWPDIRGRNRGLAAGLFRANRFPAVRKKRSATEKNDNPSWKFSRKKCAKKSYERPRSPESRERAAACSGQRWSTRRTNHADPTSDHSENEGEKELIPKKWHRPIKPMKANKLSNSIMNSKFFLILFYKIHSHNKILKKHPKNGHEIKTKNGKKIGKQKITKKNQKTKNAKNCKKWKKNWRIKY